MKDNIEIVYGKEDFLKLFELLVEDKVEQVLQKIKQDSRMQYNDKAYYASTNTNSEVDEKDE